MSRRGVATCVAPRRSRVGIKFNDPINHTHRVGFQNTKIQRTLSLKGSSSLLTSHPTASCGSSVILLREGSTWFGVLRDGGGLQMPLQAVP